MKTAVRPVISVRFYDLEMATGAAAALWPARKSQRSPDKQQDKGFSCFRNRSKIQNLKSKIDSPDHSVCSRQNIRRNSEPNLLGGLKINDHLKITRGFDW
jgi:hypothetical protein